MDKISITKLSSMGKCQWLIFVNDNMLPTATVDIDKHEPKNIRVENGALRFEVDGITSQFNLSNTRYAGA